MKKFLPFVVVLALTGCIVTLGGCASSSPRIVKTPGWSLQVPDQSPGVPSEVIVRNEKKEIVKVTGDGKSWTWLGTAEEAVEALITGHVRLQEQYLALMQQTEAGKKKPAPKSKGAKK